MRKVTITDVDGNEHVTPFAWNELATVSLIVRNVDRDGNLLCPMTMINPLGYVTQKRLEDAGVKYLNGALQSTNEDRAVELLRELLTLIGPVNV